MNVEREIRKAKAQFFFQQIFLCLFLLRGISIFEIGSGGKMGSKEKNGARKGGIGILYKLYGGKNDQVKIIAGKKITQCFYAQRERYRCLLLKV